MKPVAFAARLGALALVFALPAQAQRGGFSGHVSGGSTGHISGHFSGRAANLKVFRWSGPRNMPPPAGAGVVVRRAGGPARPPVVMASRPLSARPMILRPVVTPAVPVGFRSAMREIRTRRQTGFAGVGVPTFIGFRRFHRFHPFFFGGFGFPFCSSSFFFGFHTRNFVFFDRNFDCFPRPFFRPFFFPFATDFGPVFLTSPVVVEQTPVAAEQAAVQENANYPASTTYQPPPEAATARQPEEKKPANPLTLLQLRDGSQYGLTDYWLEDGRLHYITSYGGENSVPFEKIDLDKTVQLNFERGVEFVLRPKPSSR